MGTGTKLKCKHCGTEWYALQGTGLQHTVEIQKSVQSDPRCCPKCGSTDAEIDENTQIQWD